MSRTKSTHNVKMRDLIDAGDLNPGDELRFEPRRGEVYTGQIERDGSLTLGGERFPTPSKAATTLARRSGENPNDSRNGWKQVLCKGKALLQYRDAYEQRHPGAFRPPQIAPKPDGGPATPKIGDRTNVEERMSERERAPDFPGSSGNGGSLRDQLLNKLAHLTDKEFEEFVGRVLRQLGYEDVSVVGRSGDGGIDIECTHRLPLIDPPVSVACQVKKHANPVGPNVVGDLRGRWAHRADRLILVNLGGFTIGAKETGGEPGAKPVKLISGSELVEIMAQEGIGVLREPVVVETLDETFFSPFSSS